MKLAIKKKYIDLIKEGKKAIDYRDAHITFICDETGEKLRKNVLKVDMVEKASSLYPNVKEVNDDYVIRFHLEIPEINY